MIRDILGQAWEAMLFNRRRTAITMVGMAWGIATVVLLLAYGAGFSRAIEAIFAQWGTHTIGVFPGRTSRAGRRRQSRRPCPASPWTTSTASPPPSPVSAASRPVLCKDVPVQNDLHTYTWSVNGVRPEYQDIMKLDTDRGPLLQRRRRPAARPRLRHRLRGQNQALLRRLGARRNHPPQRRARSPSSASSAPKCRKATTTSTARSTSPSTP